jgi:riboflavin kinase / FMN adenylyltransferase
MNRVPVFAGLDQVTLGAVPVHLAIGMFDGVHLGHQAVLESAMHSARRAGGVAGALTFHPHPSVFFRRESPTRMIMPPEIKLRVLRRLGIDFVVQQPFDEAFSQVEAEEFVPLLQRCVPRLQAIYVGDNWRYGRGRRGDVGSLVAEAGQAGINVISAERISRNGEPISSTRIRECLVRGQIEMANEMLGYAYFAEGEVQPGRQLGRKLGFPTLNLAWSPELAPRYGVYAVRVSPAEGGESQPAVANYGVRPTVGDHREPLLEVHLLGDCPFGTGDRLIVDWLAFVRQEMKFTSVEALSLQIKSDRDQAAGFFKRS